MRTLAWFRADLRVDDNPALGAACANADRGVVAVFAICPRQWQEHDWGANRVEFLLRNLACLAEQLKKLNIPLRIIETATFAGVPRAIVHLARTLHCDALHFGREHEVNEARRDEAVRQACAAAGIAVHVHDNQTILPPDCLRTQEGRFYSVFTPFKKAWLEYARDGGVGACVGRPKPQPAMVCAADAIPESIDGYDFDDAPVQLWAAGEGAAKTRLGKFIADRIDAYKVDRDLAAERGTSRLSPYLAHGVLSPRVALDAVREANRGRMAGGRVGPDTWISELIWREFYRHVLVGYPHVCMGRAFRRETDALRWRHDEGGFAAWRSGRTGYPIVDAGQRQLADTGWMHNRLRMITAMFLTKDLFIDWRWGERHFMQTLVDGDFASNNGGWQWSASTGTDAAPYFRIFNPFSQAKKCDPGGAFIHEFVPELRDVPPAALHDPKRLADAIAAGGIDYPSPICDHAAARDRVMTAFRSLK